MIRRILLTIFLIFILSSCRNDLENENNELLVNTPETGKGNIIGKLLDSSTNQPYEASLFLSKNLTADYPGYPPVISFSYQTNPRAAQDDEGNFSFINIQPEKYVMVVYRPTGQDFIKDKETGMPIMFEVKENITLDLGIIEFP